MLRIGVLEQIDLSSILLRIEKHSKTGLMVVKQGGQWVEFYFRGGRLICIGPVRTNASLGERLLQDGAIAPTGLQEALLVVGDAQQSETRMALTLMDLGYISHEALRGWSARKAQEVLQVLLTWTHGEVHFEEETSPPPDRLLVALSISDMLSSIPKKTPQPAPMHVDATYDKALQEQHVPSPPVSVSYTPDAPTFINTSDLLLEDAPTMFPSTERLSAVLTPNHSNDQVPALTNPPMAQPVAVTMPTAAKRIDTSFMRPEMILIPVDFSISRDRNIQVELTPDQWRLLTKVDSHTSLQAACMELGMVPEMVCQVAGELIAEGLIRLSLPSHVQMSELSPSSRELVASGISNGYIAPASTVSMELSWSPALPSSDVLPQFSSSLPFETQSQWGNGGNGATFIPGRGWIASPQPLQPLSTSGPLAATYSDMYAQVSSSR